MFNLFGVHSNLIASGETQLPTDKPICSTFKFALDSGEMTVTQCIRFTAKEIKSDPLPFPFFDQKAEEEFARNHPMGGSR